MAISLRLMLRRGREINETSVSNLRWEEDLLTSEQRDGQSVKIKYNEVILAEPESVGQLLSRRINPRSSVNQEMSTVIMRRYQFVFTNSFPFVRFTCYNLFQVYAFLK